MANRAGNRYGFPLSRDDLLAKTAPTTGPIMNPKEYAIPTRACKLHKALSIHVFMKYIYLTVLISGREREWGHQ